MEILIKKIFIKGAIKVITGLHIGGSNNELSIGGMDNAVIRNPITREPYIPGSSLKGKMRSLLEITYGTLGERPMSRDIQNPPTNNPHHLSARLFGYTQYKPTGPEDPYKPQMPSRVIVRDGVLTNKDAMMGILVEEKSETVIDRITSAAMPRQMERVPAGAIFSLDIVINIFKPDQEAELVKGVLDGLLLVEDDFLGGAGSRGSGQVKFRIKSMTEKNTDYYKSDDKGVPQDIVPSYKSIAPTLFSEQA